MATKATVKKTVRKYSVTVVPRKNAPPCTTAKTCVVVPPCYDREIDEPAYEKAWQTADEKMQQGQYTIGTTLPKG